MTTDTRRIEDAIHELSDEALVPLLARELRSRASLRPDFSDDPRSPAELAVDGDHDELRMVAADLLVD